MAEVTRAFAERMARKVPAGWEHDQVRDYLDQATAGDLDNTQLNLLTDWVLAALAAAKPSEGKAGEQ